MHKYRELTRWQRESSGIRKWDQMQSHRQAPKKNRFNPDSRIVTKGTSKFAYRWWFYQQPFLPHLPPPGFVAPTPQGREAWPVSWTEEFAAPLLKLSNEQLQAKLLGELTDIIFQETQKDGFELRRLDYEGKPLTKLPEQSVIKNFVIEEETMRERVVHQLLEKTYRLSPTANDYSNLRSVSHFIDFVVARVTVCRDPVKLVTIAVQDVLQQCPVQPELGFCHALPHDPRSPLLVEWERQYQHDWQFGNAVFEPRVKENTRGNLTWMRLQQDWDARLEHERKVADGSARREHLARIASLQE